MSTDNQSNSQTPTAGKIALDLLSGFIGIRFYRNAFRKYGKHKQLSLGIIALLLMIALPLLGLLPIPFLATIGLMSLGFILIFIIINSNHQYLKECGANKANYSRRFSTFYLNRKWFLLVTFMAGLILTLVSVAVFSSIAILAAHSLLSVFIPVVIELAITFLYLAKVAHLMHVETEQCKREIVILLLDYLYKEGFATGFKLADLNNTIIPDLLKKYGIPKAAIFTAFVELIYNLNGLTGRINYLDDTRGGINPNQIIIIDDLADPIIIDPNQNFSINKHKQFTQQNIQLSIEKHGLKYIVDQANNKRQDQGKSNLLLLSTNTTVNQQQVTIISPNNSATNIATNNASLSKVTNDAELHSPTDDQENNKSYIGIR